ncbi:MAG TPA: cytochrome c [Pyrinomonadaceae bacterium]|jgi:cbb3-type cytochrome c oxidase subunit III|nr:cytochrome c [Pyrinomonadaceae bacterium]
MSLRAKCAALLTAGLLCFGCWSGAAGELVQKRESTRKSSASPASSTKELFASKCARCHGNDGRGETTIGRIVNAPDLTDAEWWAKRTNNRSLVSSVTNGRGGMPAFGKKLTQKEIASLVAYARTFKK